MGLIVHLNPDDTAFCSWSRQFTLTVHSISQVYKWVLANLMLGVTLQSHSDQTQKSNVSSGFRRLQLCESLKRKCKTIVGKYYKNRTGRKNYKLGVSEDVH